MHPFLHCISSFEGIYFLQNIRSSRSSISCCFCQLLHQQISIFFRTSFNVTCKKDFCRKFSFNGFTQIYIPLNAQNPLSMTKVFCQCSLTDSARLRVLRFYHICKFLSFLCKELFSDSFSIYIFFISIGII